MTQLLRFRQKRQCCAGFLQRKVFILCFLSFIFRKQMNLQTRQANTTSMQKGEQQRIAEVVSCEKTSTKQDVRGLN